MEAELVSLASTGATTLVGLMVSDGWAQVKGQVAALLGRDAEATGASGGETGAAQAELEESREELLAAREAGDEGLAGDVEAALRTRLRRGLRADPELADELRALLEELEPQPPVDGGGTVHNVISGGVQHGTVIQGRDFSGLTFNG
jgi:hypothetical protein